MAASGGGSTVARLRFEFLGDLKGYRESLKTAKTEGDTAAKTLGQRFRDALGKAPAGGYLAGLKQDLELGRSKTLILRDAASALKQTLGSLSVKGLHTGLNGIRNVLGTLKTAAGEVFRGLLMGAGIAMFQDLTRVISDLVHVIPNLISKGQAYALEIHKITAATGASTESASRMVATLSFLGDTAGNMSTIFSQLARNLPDNEKALNRLGVTTRDTNGGFLDAITIIDNVRSTLSKTSDGFAKMTQVIELFGGRGALGKLAEYFQLTDAQMAILTKHFQETGQILSAEQVRIAEDAQREWNNIQGILTGMGSTLMTIVGPQIIAFFSMVAGVIMENAKAIETAIGNALQFIFGLISGLAGWSGTVQTLTGSLGNLDGTTSANAISINNLQTELAGLQEADKKAASATKAAAVVEAARTKAAKAAADAIEAIQAQTKAATDAIEAQTKAVDKQAEALKDLVKAQDEVYAARLKNIRSLIDERLASLDAAEAARELAGQQRDLNEKLNEAQIALAEAQQGKGGKVDAEAVSSAMAQVADVQRQQADLAHQQEIAGQRESLTNAQDYIDNIAEIMKEGEDRKAVAETLGLKQRALEAALAAAQERKDEEATAILTAELQAVKTGIEQNATRLQTDAQAAAFTARKQQLQDEVAAVQSASTQELAAVQAAKTQELAAVQAASTQTNAIREAEILAEIKRLQADEAAAEIRRKLLEQHGKLFGKTFGDPKGPVQSAFEGARLAGVKFADDVKAAMEGLKGILGDIVGAIQTITGLLTNADLGAVAAAIAGYKLGGPIGAVIAAAGAGIAAAKPGTMLFDPGGPLQSILKFYDSIFGTHYSTTGQKAAGGPVTAGVPYIVGERRPEVFIPRENGSILPSIGSLRDLLRMPQPIAALAGAGFGSQTIEIPIYLDGAVIARIVSRHQADDYRR
jgi:hypothetical protein